ncbi:squalene epoxidase 3-like isoform X2 [Solanum dulcamara]|uniref:squalene epoxidase 3-like isoform X2 n=1 Tax=Solanum dulcamara TaxID=45834 RepID=UPI0024865394|nr:squalene epoxidase 3-like isoform X2 [Solanum dulcamara]
MLLINTNNNNYLSFSVVFSKHNFSVSATQTTPPPPPFKSPFSQALASNTEKKLKLPLVSLSKSLRNTQFGFIQDEKMVNFMMDKYIVPSFVVSLLGFLLLYIILRRRTSNYKKKDHKSTQKCDTHNVISSNLTNGECESKKGNDTDVIIVGAGVAGAALAHTLAKEGRKVHVIERDLTEPDRIVGELLQPGGYLKLIELGIEDCVEDIDAQRVVGYALFKDGKSTNVSYPLKHFHSDVAGRSFHNGRFIQKMREKAATLLNVRLEQGTVTSLIEENGSIKGVQYKTKAGQELKAHAPLTVVCDGCFSNLRRSLCDPKVDVPSCFVGLVLELENDRLPYPNHGHVILADPSPILFYPISSTEIRCLVDVPGQKLPSLANGDMANYLKTMVAPQVPPELRDAFLCAIDKGHIKTMPNRSMPAAPYPTPGALLLGDSFNMRHPLTGGGMTVALSDIAVLRNLLMPLQDLNDADELCKYLESFYTLRKWLPR